MGRFGVRVVISMEFDFGVLATLPPETVARFVEGRGDTELLRRVAVSVRRGALHGAAEFESFHDLASAISDHSPPGAGHIAGPKLALVTRMFRELILSHNNIERIEGLVAWKRAEAEHQRSPSHMSEQEYIIGRAAESSVDSRRKQILLHLFYRLQIPAPARVRGRRVLSWNAKRLGAPGVLRGLYGSGALCV